MTIEPAQAPTFATPTADQFATIVSDAASKTEPIHMINMVRFKEQAEYHAAEQSGDETMSGAEA